MSHYALLWRGVIYLGHRRTDGRGVIETLELLDLVVVVQLHKTTPPRHSVAPEQPQVKTTKPEQRKQQTKSK